MFYTNEDTFYILFEAIPEGVIIVNNKQLIIAANHSAEKMFGYKIGSLINKPLEILIPQKYRQNHKRIFRTFLKKSSIRRIQHGLDLFGLTKRGRQFPVEIGLNPFNVNGNTFIIALVIDVTKRKEIEKKIDRLNLQLEKKVKLRTAKLNNTIKQLKELNINYKAEIKRRKSAESKLKSALKKEIELNELKTKFLSLVSHEFKTPLSGILTSVYLLKKYQLSNQQEKRDKHIKTIASKVHYLNNILNDFLSIERLDTGKVSYKFTTFNLSKIVNEVVYNANMLLKNGQKINMPKNADAIVLHQDEKILELALTNLIHNAIKFSPENTTINIEIFKDNNNIKFKITDEGIGIPEKDQKYVFRRYFRAENALNIQGTGIGLNIIKVHLENLGGSISFKSEENQGSVFIVELPIQMEL